MKIRARLWRREGTEREIDGDDFETAADDYVAQFVELEPDAVSFVEVLEDGERWVLWRVQALCTWPILALGTERVTDEEAAREYEAETTIRGAIRRQVRECVARVRSWLHVKGIG